MTPPAPPPFRAFAQSKLGEGEFSEVRYGLRKTNRQAVAIKVIVKSGTASSVRLAQEVQIMQHCTKMNCEHLVQLYDVFETETVLYMVRPGTALPHCDPPPPPPTPTSPYAPPPSLPPLASVSLGGRAERPRSRRR